MELTILIPVLNEERTIGTCVKKNNEIYTSTFKNNTRWNKTHSNVDKKYLILLTLTGDDATMWIRKVIIIRFV